MEGNWSLTESVWHAAELLILVQPDEFRATWVRWSAERAFEGWVVNMQSRLTRTHLGFDYRDHQLDLVVDRHRDWHWKDEAELEFAVELGRMTREQADAVCAEGECAVEAIDGNRSPLSDAWESSTPDPGWSVPEMAEDWDDRSMYE